MSKKKLSWDTWLHNTEKRVRVVLQEMFGDKNEATDMHIVSIDIGNKVIPTSLYKDSTITKEKLYGDVIQELCSSEIASALLDISNTLVERVLKDSPDRFRMTKLAIQHGVSMNEVFLDFTYSYCEIHIDGYELCKRSNIEIVEG